MDSMAYLQQIATDGNGAAKAQATGLGKFLNIKTAIIALIATVLIIAVCLISSMLGTSDTKEQDLLTHSWFKSTYLISVLDEYTGLIKSSDLRANTASLQGVLREIVVNDADILMEEFGIEVSDLEESDIAIDERTAIAELSEALNIGRLSGTLDRVFCRELTLQVAYLTAYQSEISERSETASTQEAVLKAESNLKNIYDRYDSFSDLSV